jgi:molybdopterin-guanine dinucleotide biosynthesis protein A
MEPESRKQKDGFPDKPYGVVVCGGNSSRMGTDKSLLVYHQIPQYQYVHDLLAPITQKVLLSCHAHQFESIDVGMPKIVDLAQYAGHGPIAAVLTAMYAAPDQDLLIVGCDYPFLEAKDLSLFMNSIQRDSLAAAFYNNQDIYEPMLAWFSKNAAPLLQAFFENKQYSLQKLLREIRAEKYVPESERSMISVDTPEDFRKAFDMLSNKK